MKHFKQLTLIFLTFSLLLYGCGGTQTNGTNDNNVNNSTNGDPNNNSIVEKDQYTFSEYLFNGEHIWYFTEGYGKDDKIKTIYVTEPDGTMYYCKSDWNLGEAEQKEDSEIIAYVKQEYENNMSEQANYLISWEGKITDGTLLTTSMSSMLAPYLDNITPAPFKLSIISDSTGNNTSREVLAYQEFAPLSFDDNIWDAVAKVTYIELSHLAGLTMEDPNCHQIYDSWYGGYLVKAVTPNVKYLNTNQITEGCFLTRVESNKLFKLDSVGTENIGIDNADSLFEKIVIDMEWEHIPE